MGQAKCAHRNCSMFTEQLVTISKELIHVNLNHNN
jgi:hypothetical protein